ncbi:MAG: gliding motility lipoprotein GldD [Candidatus Symbiothrix sp.]|jgi:gliding motility-associated lipoprotein GldD|nr:gliding motility lipoprotein GldD [Candidatus Symbiothrix sp.]
MGQRLTTAIYCSWFMVYGLWFAACTDYSPKPSGYFRMDIPAPDYRLTDDFKRFAFEVSDRAFLTEMPQNEDGVFFNITYPDWDAEIYCSFIPIKKDNFAQLSEESRKFVYLHAIKADVIRERAFKNQGQNVYGLVYEIEGNVASPVQFVLTDSVSSFFRGALYFNHTPNRDSIAPVLESINNDIQVLIESFQWKK